ncbi:TPA: response regulator transcription factor [Serratia marcescens]|nr:response regulator transcription factor [Serratia marcescens]
MKKKKTIVVMDPVFFNQQSMVHMLHNYFNNRLSITDVVSSISEIMRMIILEGPADIYLMEAYGHGENYKSWSDFINFMGTYYPSVTCLIWSSKPTVFLRKLNSLEGRNPCWQIPKKIGIDCFVDFFRKVLDGEASLSSNSTNCIESPMCSLTLSEMVIITDVIEGGNIKRLAKKYNVTYKTVSAHKRNAMIKMGISSTAQLRSLFKDGCILRGEKDRNLPIRIKEEQPILLSRL